MVTLERVGEEARRHWNAKLTEDHVRALRRERAQHVSITDLAAKYGLTYEGVRQILRDRVWKGVA